MIEHKGRKDVKLYMRKIVLSCMSLLVLLTGSLTYVTAQKSRVADSERHSRKAADAFADIMNVREKAIPRELLDKAEAIAVFPDVVKAAFIVGGSGGQGVISRRIRGGWSQPVFFNLGGGSFGAQIGAAQTDYILLIMNDDGLKGLLKDKFELGGEVGIAAGPIGRELSASTNPRLDAGILSYSRSKGVFIGAALKGASISPDNNLNEAVYKRKAEQLLTGKLMTLKEMPPQVRIFPRTLARYSIR